MSLKSISAKLGKGLIVVAISIVVIIAARMYGAHMGEQAAIEEMAGRKTSNSSKPLKDDLMLLTGLTQNGQMFSRFLRLDSVKMISEHELIYYISMPEKEIAEFNLEELGYDLAQEARELVCTHNQQLSRLIERGARFTYAYSDKNNFEFVRFTVSKEVCSG